MHYGRTRLSKSIIYCAILSILLVGSVFSLTGCAQIGLPTGDYDHVYQRAMPSMSIRDDGTFKLLQVTDTHLMGGNNSYDKKTLAQLDKVLSNKYDLVVLTGDIFEGICSNSYDKPSIVANLINLFDSHSQKFTYVAGNNDGEMLGSDKDIVLQFLGSDNFVFSDTKVQGCGNFYIRLVDNDGNERHRLIMFDTSHRDENGKYIAIGNDQVEWYDSVAMEAIAQGVRHSLFVHIPFDNIENVVNQGKSVTGDNNLSRVKKFWSEMGNGNDRLFAATKKNQCSLVVGGHLHNVDVAKLYENMVYKVSRASGVYMNLGKDFSNGVCEITIDTSAIELGDVYAFNTITY